MFPRLRNRFLVVVVAGAALGGVILAVPGATAPSATAQVLEPADGRIAFAGTAHRSLGVLTDPVPEQLRSTEPLFPGGQAHFDDQVSTRGGLVVFTSLRDSVTPEVYLRAEDGSVRRLTTGHDAGHPQLSPDLGSVVFDSAVDGQRDLWLVGVDGSAPRRLTDDPADQTWPSFSPDGTEVAYADAGDGQIHRRPVAGGDDVQVTFESGVAGSPAWNPVDGNSIAYTVEQDGEVPVQIWVTGTGTGAARDEYPSYPEHPTYTQLLGGDHAGWASHWPVWKTDGTGLLFLSTTQVCGCPADPNAEKVYQVDTSGGLPVTEVPGLLLAEDRLLSAPAWLTDPPRLLVSRTTAATRNTVTLQDIRPDGVDPRDLGLELLREDPEAVNDPNLLFRPRPGYDPWFQRQNYSPDGRSIVVSRFEDLDGARVQRIWVVDADGANPRRLPVADRAATDWEFDPTWSPDGRFVAFARRSPGGVRPEGGQSRVVVVEVATGAVVGQLRPPAEVADQEDTQPAWSPDGTTLSFTRGLVTDGPDGEVRYNHIWTARAGTLDQQRDLTTEICGFDCDVTDDSSGFDNAGQYLVFNREADGLLRVPLTDGGCEVLLPATPATCAGPVSAPGGPFQPRDAAFAPDDGRLVLTDRRAQDAASPEQLTVLDPATGTLDPITAGLPGRQKEPTWQPSADLTVSAPPTTPDTPPDTTVTVPVQVGNQGPATTEASLTVVVPDGLRLDALRPERGTCAEQRCDLGTLVPGDVVLVEADLVGLAPGRPTVTWSVAGPVLDTRPADNASETEIPVGSPPPPPAPPAPPPSPPPAAGPGVTVVVGPDPSYVGGRATVRYTVRNRGGSLATGLRLDFRLPARVPVAAVPPGCSASGCALPDLAPGVSGVVVVLLAPTVPLRTTVRGELRTTGTDADRGDNVASARLRVVRPRIVAVPAIGEPGFVTSVRGLDFPPGTPVRLTWTPGITASAVPTIPRRDGTFAAQLLILAKDQTGPRTITATGAGFTPATTPFLVVPGSIGPPDMVARR
ncbi:PD40 domain-containing protein [Actinophytocola xinjiangensis]|uniref:PD40 domain-containing protein n=1 Tax=Actinophytocola xinjiangensis TaxID=485602 RepID=UPI000A069124|nr:PD40 domain-containing protein [Actinophytocola xinjiangensis]